MSSKSALAELKEELANRQQNVIKAEEKLMEAKAELAKFLGEAAATLGLPKPGERGEKMRSVCARRKAVRELLGAGKSEDEIAASLGVPAELVFADVAVIRRRSREPSGDSADEGEGDVEDGARRGWKRKRVLELYLEGKSRSEIGDDLQIDKSCVGSHLTALRKQGLLPSDDHGEESEEVSGESGSPEEASYEGDSIASLKEEVQRQQGGQRTKRASLATTASLGHAHKVEVDRMGDGLTTHDETGHQHMVHRFVVGRVKDHTHDLKKAGSS